MSEPIASVIGILAIVGGVTIIWSIAGLIQYIAQEYYDRHR